MKKKSLPILLAASLLALSAAACGTENAAPSGQETPTAPADTTAETDTADEAAGVEGTEKTDEGAENADEDDTNVTNKNTAETEGENTVSTSVSVTFQETHDEIKADDGTLLLENTVSMPVVSIEGADEIAAKINADIEKYFNLSSDEETIALAKSDYEASQADEDGGWFRGYVQSVSADVTRMDDKVLSLEVTSYSDTGGAHGNYGGTGLNYDIRTGEPILLEKLSEDYEAFHAAALDYIVNLAQTPTYQEKLFDPSKEDLDSALLTWGNWVFTQSGISFFSGPYVLGSYASGEIHFLLPYERAYEVGLKEEYRYNGNFMEERYYTTQYDPETMEPLVDGTPEYSFDLNGDGTEEGVAFYGLVYAVESDAPQYGLYIDGKDWGDVVYEQIGDAGTNGYLHTSYALYDSDPSDSLTEIAVMFTTFDGDTSLGSSAERSHYTYLFRYTAEKELQFVERLDGYITNPLSSN